MIDIRLNPPRLRAPGTLATCCFLLLAAGCESVSPPPPETAAIWIADKGLTIAAGDTVRMFARFRASPEHSIDTIAAAWSSTDASVASISMDGVLQTHNTGRTVIWAEHGGVRDSALVRVAQEVLGGRGWEAVEVGEGFACASASSGSIYCWGLNWYGAFGNGLRWRSGVHSPVLATEVPSDLGGLAVGYLHACGIAPDGAAYCWGSGGGMLGTGSLDHSPRASRVAWQQPFTMISAGANSTCGLDVDGVRLCWGSNVSDELGVGGGLSIRAVPASLPGDSAYAAIAQGDFHGCGLTASGRALCWGRSPAVDAPLDRSPVPVPVPTDLRFVAITSANSHSCALTAEGDVYCWGANEAGSLGHPGAPRGPSPVHVQLAVPAARVVAGHLNSCAITVAGALHCWGLNDRGQVGVDPALSEECTLGAGGKAQCVRAPHHVDLGEPVRDVALSSYLTCALTEGGRIFCWGDGAHGARGAGRPVGRSWLPNEVVAPLEG
jgi:alpha-tubulin suppressor-like RCC1 family protein